MRILSLLFIALFFLGGTSQSAAAGQVPQEQPPTPQKLVQFPTVALKLPEVPGRPAATLIVSEVPAEQEEGSAKALATREGTVFFTAETNDPVNAELDGNATTILSADRPEDLPIFEGSKGRQALAQIQEMVKNQKERIKKGSPALLIALIPATGYGTYFWFLSSHFMQGAGGFAWEYILTAAIGVYTHEWLAFSKGVGDQVNAGAMLIASKVGHKWSPMAQKRWRRTGQVLAAYGLNLASAFVILGIGGDLGDWHNDFFAFMFAMFASHEVVDFSSERMLHPNLVQKAVWVRQCVYAMLELMTLSGVHTAELFAGSTVGAAVLAFIFKEQAVSIGTKFLSHLKKLNPFQLRRMQCEEELAKPQKTTRKAS